MLSVQEKRLQEFQRVFEYSESAQGLVLRVDFCKKKAGERPGTLDVFPTNTYRKIYLHGKQYREHQIVWELHYGSIPKGLQIDHIDGVGTNNCIQNLRLVSPEGNRKNTRMRCDNKSGQVGVIFYRATERWMAYINFLGRRIHLGFFDKKMDAISARKEAEKRYGYTERHGKEKIARG